VTGHPARFQNTLAMLDGIADCLKVAAFASHELGLSPEGCHVLAAALECITAKLKPLDTSGWRLVTRKGGVYAHP
jgi:hypothetical protein